MFRDFEENLREPARQRALKFSRVSEFYSGADRTVSGKIPSSTLSGSDELWKKRSSSLRRSLLSEIITGLSSGGIRGNP